MVNLNGKDYKLYYLDTCALSGMVKDRAGFGSNLLNLVLDGGVIAISPYSIWELKSSPSIYKDVLDVITVLPSVLLKSNQSLFEDEFDNFINSSGTISPITSHLIKGEHARNGVDLIAIIDQNVTEDMNRTFAQERKKTFEILESKPSNIYSREQLSSPSTIEVSVSFGALQLAAVYKSKEIQSFIDNTKTPFPTERFPSITSISYMAHYKYLEQKRTGSESDIVDISMASLYPYVDVVITEAHQCEMIRQIKTRHDFFTNLKAITIRQVRTENYENII